MAELDDVTTEEEDEVEVLTLTDDEGNEVDFAVIATLDYKENEYVVLEPIDEIEGYEENTVMICRIVTDAEGNDLIESIADEKLLDEVFAEFCKLQEQCDCEDGCDGECNCGCKE